MVVTLPTPASHATCPINQYIDAPAAPRARSLLITTIFLSSNTAKALKRAIPAEIYLEIPTRFSLGETQQNVI